MNGTKNKLPVQNYPNFLIMIIINGKSLNKDLFKNLKVESSQRS